jgi:hypothetical protein
MKFSGVTRGEAPTGGGGAGGRRRRRYWEGAVGGERCGWLGGVFVGRWGGWDKNMSGGP